MLALKDHIDGIWDLTIQYEPLDPNFQYPENLYGLVDLFGYLKSPKIIKVHIKYWKIQDIPFEDDEPFEFWLRNSFYKKDKLLLDGSVGLKKVKQPVELDLISRRVKCIATISYVFAQLIFCFFLKWIFTFKNT